MRKVLIFGNSGSGKSTLAKSIAESDGLAHFDLDTIAWLPTDPPERTSIEKCREDIQQFTGKHNGWIIEGCYADLLELAAPVASEMIFLNLSTDDCVANAIRRPFEPHKYESKAAQDANLEMLLGWIQSYPTRDDSCSLRAHQELFARFEQKKTMRTQNR